MATPSTAFDALLASARTGDSDAFVKLCQPFRREFLRKAKRRLGGTMQRRADPEDVLQVTLQEAWKSFASFKAESPAGWATWFRSVFNHQLDQFLRDQLREKRTVGKEESVPSATGPGVENLLQADQTSPSQAAARNENLRRLDEAIEALSTDERAAVIRVKLEGEAPGDVAHELGRTAPAVRGLLRRALAKVAERFRAPESPRGSSHGPVE